jgi:hypothetical protein
LLNLSSKLTPKNGWSAKYPEEDFCVLKSSGSRPRDRQLAKIAAIFDFGGAARKPLAQGDVSTAAVIESMTGSTPEASGSTTGWTL